VRLREGMIKKSAAMSLLLILRFLAASNVHAQTGQMLDEYGASPKSIAMGQAFTAIADDFSATYYNPAGLTQTKGIVEMSLGIFYAKQNATATLEYVPYRSDNDMPSEITGQRTTKGFIIGIASSLDVPSLVTAYPWFRRFAFGMVFWLNYPEMLTYDVGPEPYRPHFFRYDEGFALMAMVGSVALEITPWLSLGGGAFMSQKTYSRQEVYSALNYMGVMPWWPADEVVGSRLSIWSEAEIVIVPTLGLLFKPPVKSLQDRLSFGISWRKESKSHHARGQLIANIGIEDPDVPGKPTEIGWSDFVNTTLSSIVGFSPQQLTFGLAGEPIEGLSLALDVTWKEYSEYVTYYDVKPDPPFENTVVPRLGVEYAFDPGFSSRWLSWMALIAIRAGYYFEPTPVPSADKSHNIFDTDQDVVSTGFQIDFPIMQGRILSSIEAYFQYHLLRDRYIKNDEDPFFGPADLGGHVINVGGTLTTRF
jgi:long-chain fatty acid transport protein